MLSNKEDFDRFMADDDISAYVAILKSNIRDINSHLETLRMTKKYSKNDFFSIKEFGIKLVENINCDEICSLYKIDKSYVYSIISTLNDNINQYNSRRVREDSVIMNSTFPIFWKLKELADSEEKKQVLFIYDIIQDTGFDSFPNLNLVDYPNSHCKRISGWKHKALKILK